MNESTALPTDQIRNVRGGRVLRMLNKCLPLGRLYHPFVAALNSPHGLFSLPVESTHLLMPAAWRKSATQMLLNGLDSSPEFRLLEPMLQELTDGCLVDVGANIGLYTILFRAKSRLPIFAFEPQPLLFQMLEWNRQFNHLQNTRVKNLGCGEKPGETLMHAGLNGSIAAATEKPPEQTLTGRHDEDWEQRAAKALAGHQWERVQIVTLDDELAGQGRVALLKIDCEGYELNILRGAGQILSQPDLRLFVEIHPAQLKNFGQSAAEVVNLLSESFDLEFWTFQEKRAKTKIGRSLARCQRPRPYRFSSAAEFLAFAETPECPSQVYCLGKKRP